ncbi:NUDIX hydrolase [Rhizobium sp. S152]|uniref:NUDIX hydrolase n=1 Tax=Rhizobium sp. S152 TaxID=3055038 RepID=UPI0025A9C0AB|nr:NUDIX hydrolase [Rhizobium sp. S152]MDM9627760.1 NUDIX hydrolase [Rhizobium sp. S152]
MRRPLTVQTQFSCGKFIADHRIPPYFIAMSQKSSMRALVHRGVQHGDKIKQYGALCVRATSVGTLEVLLITTRQTKRWTIPKGWPIKGLEPHKVAEQEAWEEAGVIGRAKKRAFGSFTYTKRLAGGALTPALVEVHVLDVGRCRRRFPEWNERTLLWLPPAEAARLIAEFELQRILRQLQNMSRRASP